MDAPGTAPDVAARPPTDAAISGAKRKYREVSIRKGYALKERSARCPSPGRALGRMPWPMRSASGR